MSCVLCELQDGAPHSDLCTQQSATCEVLNTRNQVQINFVDLTFKLKIELQVFYNHHRVLQNVVTLQVANTQMHSFCDVRLKSVWAQMQIHWKLASKSCLLLMK